MLTVTVEKHINFLNGESGIFQEEYYGEKVWHDEDRGLLWVYTGDGGDTIINLNAKHENVLSVKIVLDGIGT